MSYFVPYCVDSQYAPVEYVQGGGFGFSYPDVNYYYADEAQPIVEDAQTADDQVADQEGGKRKKKRGGRKKKR